MLNPSVLTVRSFTDNGDSLVIGGNPEFIASVIIGEKLLVLNAGTKPLITTLAELRGAEICALNEQLLHEREALTNTCKNTGRVAKDFVDFRVLVGQFLHIESALRRLQQPNPDHPTMSTIGTPFEIERAAIAYAEKRAALAAIIAELEIPF